MDEHSIKVDGSGHAIITDTSVIRIDNKEIFEDVYPEFEPGFNVPPPVPPSEDELDVYVEEDGPELTAAQAELQRLRDEQDEARELAQSAADRLRFLDNYGDSLGKFNTPSGIDEKLNAYREEREKAYRDQVRGDQRRRELDTALDKAFREVSKLQLLRNYDQQKAAYEREKAVFQQKKEIEKKHRDEKKELEKRQARKTELMNFWPKYVYSVCITIEVALFTPATSRRSSVTSEIELAKSLPETPTPGQNDGQEMRCDLVLSYVTISACWSPSYDIQMSTTNGSGSLLFDAQLHNSTSETWENCKIVLSTSQATATSLNETPPDLVPWHIRLAHTRNGLVEDILHSKEEKGHQQHFLAKKLPTAESLSKRKDMFGLDGTSDRNKATSDYQMQLMLLEQQNKRRLAMARTEPDRGGPIFRDHKDRERSHPRSPPHRTMSAYAPPPPPPHAPAPAAAASPPAARMQKLSRARANSHTHEEEKLDTFDFDGFLGSNLGETAFGSAAPTVAAVQDQALAVDEDAPALHHPESMVEEVGFTTTYDLPGLKTLAPKLTSTKQRVARISLGNIAFLHSVVAKYKPVAHLKAELRNTSKLTLLRGDVGVTLDGSFMGRTVLPRCSPGEALTVNLGIDPSVRVTYPKPSVRRATTGVFTKEDSSVYMRSVTLENTRASSSSSGKAITLHVLDQIPVSEDERLKVEVHTPKGLSPTAGPVAAGIPGKVPADSNWGRASATVKKNGEVCWQVSLNPGKTVRLGLEYAVIMPNGDRAIQC